MRQALTVALVLVALAFFFSGCATNPEGELARLLADLENLDAPLSAADANVASESSDEAPVAPSIGAGATDEAARTNDVAATETASAVDEVETTHFLRIHPNCLVQISVAEDPSLNGSYSVNDFGAVELGYVGPVILINKTEKEAAEKIKDVLITRDFRTANVKVRILRASYGNIKVMGAVRSPGLVKVGAGDSISLNDALLRVNGLSPDGKGGKVRIYRNGMLYAVPEVHGWEEFSMKDENGNLQVPEVQLRINDLAYVMTQNARTSAQPLGDKVILLLGEVGRPGFQRFSGAEPCTMMHLLFRIGELPPFANKKSIKVVRRDEEGFEQEFVINGQEILDHGRPEDDFPLEDGDRIIVPARRFTLM